MQQAIGDLPMQYTGKSQAPPPVVPSNFDLTAGAQKLTAPSSFISLILVILQILATANKL